MPWPSKLAPFGLNPDYAGKYLQTHKLIALHNRLECFAYK